MSKSSPGFNNKATLNRSVKRAVSALPKSLLKKVRVIHKIISDLSPVKQSTLSKMMRWKNSSSSKGRKLALSDEKMAFILDFLKFGGMSYTMPGKIKSMLERMKIMFVSINHSIIYCGH